MQINTSENGEDPRDSLLLAQWDLFSNLINGVAPSTDILCAVYSGRRESLMFPGSNIKKARDALGSPSQLNRFLRQNSPNPRNGVLYAGESVIKLIEQNPSMWVDYGISATLESGNAQRVTLVNLAPGASIDSQDLQVKLNWPQEFRDLLYSTFEAQDVLFFAFPLVIQGHSAWYNTTDVAFVYLRNRKSPDPDTISLICWLRDVIHFGVLTYASEQMAIRDARAARINAISSDYVLHKFGRQHKDDELINQAKRLNDLNDLCDSFHLHIPRTEPYNNHLPWHYRMPKYPLPSLRRLLLSNSQPTPSDARTIGRRLVDYLGTELYSKNRKDDVNDNFAPIHINMKGRLDRKSNDTIELLNSIKNGMPVVLPKGPTVVKYTNSHEVLMQITANTNENPCFLNDELFESPQWIFQNDFSNDELSEDDKRRLYTKYSVPTHGDLHFDNVLVDSYFPEEPFFVLVDPGGKDLFNDPALDMAKLLFSALAGYDFIDTGYFDLNIVPNMPDNPAKFIHLHLRMPNYDEIHLDMAGGAVAAGLISKEWNLPRETSLVYKEIADGIVSGIRGLETTLEDPELSDRTLYCLAVTCLTLNPTHNIRNPDGTLGMMARGALLRKWWRERNKSLEDVVDYFFKKA